MPPRTLAIGDIHGCHVALDVLLSQLAPTADDTVVVVGDVVDRGPGTRQAVERLLELRRTCQFILIAGNHEEMMFRAITDPDQRHSWMQFGGLQTLASYGGGMNDIPDDHLSFLKSGMDYWESDSEIFVHANLQPGVPLHKQADAWLRWTWLTGLEAPHPSGKRVICGHTSQKSGLPLAFDGWVCIDTRAYDDRFLTGLDVGSNEVFQAQQSGMARSFHLSEVS